jgi:hypothetical protein
MKLSRLAVPLGLINLALLVALAVRGDVAGAAATEPVLRAERIELVDAAGAVRAELGTEEGGEVVLRLRDERGNIRVKLGAGALGSGLLLADETADVGVHIRSGISRLTHRRDTGITLAEPDGTKREIRPEDATPQP